MADHLPLPAPLSLTGRKRRPGYGDDESVFDTRTHATTLRGVLEGLASTRPGLFDSSVAENEPDTELEADDLGRIVLKITGSAPFQTSGLGAWTHKFIQLGFNEHRTFYALSDADSRAFFKDLVEKYNADPDGFEALDSWRKALQNIQNVELYSREDRIAPDLLAPDVDEVIVVDVSVWPTSLIAQRSAVKVAKERLAELEQIIEDTTDERVMVLFSDGSNPDRILLRARVDGPTLDKLLEHPLVEKIRGPLTVEVTTEDLAGGSWPADEFEAEGAAIGIIDDLVIDANPWMEGVVQETKEFPSGGVFGTPTSHGTNVAAIAAWGRVADLLDGQVLRSPTPIYSARVAHANSQGQGELVGEPIRQVEAAMRWLKSKHVRVIVIAFAYGYADDGALHAELSALIDTVARELNLVVVVSAGNLTSLPSGMHWKTHYPSYLNEPYARIAAPGSAALATTVGSVAHSDAPDLAQFPSAVRITTTGQFAPFSRTGPTTSGRHKPEFSAHGGSWTWDHATSDVQRRDPNVATVSLTAASGGRLFTAVSGTSFAAPRVAHEVAKIATRYPKASANLLRALTALAGTPPQNMPVVIHSSYGIPEAETILESQGNTAILVHEDRITGNTYQVIEVPIVDEFAETGTWDREFRIALAYDPGVRRSRRDYISGHMNVSFVRNKTLEEIEEIYRIQPTLAARKAGKGVFHDLPGGRDRPNLIPGSQSVLSDTVMCRNYRTHGNSWDPEDRNYFIVLEHTYSPWTEAQRKEYPEQTYAVAVQLIAHGKPQLDLHALTKARIETRGRQRGRA